MQVKNFNDLDTIMVGAYSNDLDTTMIGASSKFKWLEYNHDWCNSNDLKTIMIGASSKFK